MDSVIGIDVGTGSVRGCAFDLEGNQISEPEGNSQMILQWQKHHFTRDFLVNLKVLEIKTLTESHNDAVFYMQSSGMFSIKNLEF